MRVRRTLERVVQTVARRPAVTIGIVLALALGGGALALRLTPNTSTGTFLTRAVAAVNQEGLAVETGAQRAVASARQSAYKLALAEHMSKKQALAEENAAGQLASEQQYEQLIQMYLNSGISGRPKIDD